MWEEKGIRDVSTDKTGAYEWETALHYWEGFRKIFPIKIFFSVPTWLFQSSLLKSHEPIWLGLCSQDRKSVV